MKTLFLFWFLVSCFVSTGTTSLDPCPLQSNQARCLVKVGDYPVQAKIIVNPCHQPVDVTFLLKAKSVDAEWKHTFVITNSAESQEVPGFPDRLVLHVTTANLEPKEVLLTAELLTLKENGVIFMNSTIHIRELKNCRYLGSSYISHVVAGVMMPLLLLVLSVGSFLLYCKCRKNTMDKLMLVENMAGLPGASPYQEGNPSVSFHKNELSEQELIIENNFATSPNESTA